MLAEIHEYIAEKSQMAADKYVDGIYGSVKKLEKHPESCGPCKAEILKERGYRCCKYKSHIIIYRFEYNVVNILAIIHSKRDPSRLDEIP